MFKVGVVNTVFVIYILVYLYYNQKGSKTNENLKLFIF